MHRAIAIETSGRLGSVAIVESGCVLGEEEFPHDFKHAAGIVAVIDRLMRSHGWSPKNLAQVYVSAGPGSFTGLRIGITVAKTLAFSLGLKVVAVPSTDVLARNAPPGWENCVIVLDAKRGQVFTASYSNREGRTVRIEPAHLDALPQILERTPRPVHLIGEGIPYHRQVISNDARIIITAEEAWRARAQIVAEMGWEMAQAEDFADANTLTPIYIRRPEAEEKWDQSNAAREQKG